jgi:type VI secretion system protein VasG
MADISRTALFGKLDELAYRSLESATVFCKMRGNPYVELSHWLHQILQQPDSDLHRIVRHYEVDAARLARDLLEALDRLPRGATSVSDLSIHVEEAVERGWLYASLKYNLPRVRVGHLAVGLTKSSGLRNALTAVSREFLKLPPDDLLERLSGITAGSPEDRAAQAGAAPETPSSGGGGLAPAPMGRMEALGKFSVDLTERARRKEIDPIVGRDEEIRQLVQVLMRRRQNNPILTGEAGVGKTAVVEGFAQRIASGDVPPALKDVSLRALDIGLLQAGASVKGEFENRLRQVIEEVQSSPKPIILFIDEAHTLIGAGGNAGTGDAANLLKPALARGTLRTVAATTWAEYKKHIEKDPALTRRFQVVKVEEPSELKATLMMRGVASVLETHHRVHLSDDAIRAAVTLSHRYIPDRQLPDKSVSLLDTACARVAISQHAVPPSVEDTRRTIEALETELAIVDRENAIGMDTGDRKPTAEKAIAEARERLVALEQRWQKEKGLVEQVLATRDALRKARTAGTSAPDAEERTRRMAHLAGLERELEAVQGEDPLVLPGVDENAVASVVSDWTGIPVGRMVKNEIEAVLRLADVVGKRVIGQSHALEMIAKRIQTARAGLENPNKPIGVFLLVGPSGVGKTETALALAEALYGGEQNVITINMSEFQEAHTVSTLKGAPPGYVGYGEGGVLTEAVRRRPYSVVLLDEVEKAHPDVHEIFFQVFDKGWMEDGQGTRVDFKNTIILLTSNAGSDTLMQLCASSRERPTDGALQAAIRPGLLEVFPAALLGRMVVIPYYPLSDEMLGAIVRLQLDRITSRVRDAYAIPFTYDQAVVDLVIARCTEVESGGRMIDAVLTNSLLPQMSRELLRRRLEGIPPKRVEVTASASEFGFAFE